MLKMEARTAAEASDELFRRSSLVYFLWGLVVMVAGCVLSGWLVGR
jgi:hypothetical protein